MIGEIICYYIVVVDYPDRVRRVNASRGDGRGYRGFNAFWDGVRADARAVRIYACGMGWGRTHEPCVPTGVGWGGRRAVLHLWGF